MTSRLLISTLLVLPFCHPVCAGNTYTLNQPPIFDSHPYGFSGTITTDGSLGVQSTLDFVESWSITVMTPATNDGVSSEVLTPSNSEISLDLAGLPGLLVTPDFIFMPHRTRPSLQLVWHTTDSETEIRFTNRFTGPAGLGTGVSISDPSESNSGLGVLSQELPFATAIPEPTTFALALPGLYLVTRRHRKRL